MAISPPATTMTAGDVARLPPLDAVLQSLLQLDALAALSDCKRAMLAGDRWLPAHLADLLYACACTDVMQQPPARADADGPQARNVREYLVLGYARQLMQRRRYVTF